MTDTVMQMPAPTAAKDTDALIAYIGPLFIWTMMKHGDNPSYVWHAKNAAGIFAVDLAIVIALQVLWIVMPLGLFAIFGLVAWIVRVAMGLVSIYALWQTWNGKQAVIPFVSGLGQKIPLEKWFHQKGMSAPAAEAPVAAPAPEVTPAPVVEAPAPAPMPEPAPAPMPEPTPAPVVTAPVPAPMPEPMPMPAAPAAPEAPVVAAPTEPTPPAPTV